MKEQREQREAQIAAQTDMMSKQLQDNMAEDLNKNLAGLSERISDEVNEFASENPAERFERLSRKSFDFSQIQADNGAIRGYQITRELWGQSALGNLNNPGAFAHYGYGDYIRFISGSNN